MNYKYEIRDPLYGFIQFNEWERDIINHPAFQRLRRIKQLSLTDFIYPGATHTRFEHSLGVMHLATKMFEAIVSKKRNRDLLKEKLNYSDEGFEREKVMVRLAGLLHDVGHAPFSHTSEKLFPLKEGSKDKHYEHEDYSYAIIKNLLKDVIDDHPYNSNYGIRAEDIANLLQGKGGRYSFWKILLSSQLDADRSDYLQRDSLHMGVKYGMYDLDRLLVSLTLGIDPETEELVLGIDKEGWHVAEAIVIARYQMFSQVYFHKTRRAYDYMLQQAIKETINSYPPPSNLEEYLKYDDYELWSLLKVNKDSEWFPLIEKRNHVRLLFETREISLKEELHKLEKVKKILDDAKIWYWEDDSIKKKWYKTDEEGELEIKIIENEKAVPLSEFSVIVTGLQQQFTRSRIYVKFEDRGKSKELLKKSNIWRI